MIQIESFAYDNENC